MRDYEFTLSGGGDTTIYTIKNVPEESYQALRKLFQLPTPYADWMPQIWPLDPEDLGWGCDIEIDWQDIGN